MTKHTPGPWEISAMDQRTIGHVRTVIVEDLGGYTQTPIPQLQAVCVVKERTGFTEANARLIAAAPTMKDLLERIAELTDGTFCDDDVKRNLAEIGDETRTLLASVEGKP